MREHIAQFGLNVKRGSTGVSCGLPVEIHVKARGAVAVWEPGDIADSADGVWLFIADRLAEGWTAVRVGDVLMLHPCAADLAYLGWDA